MQIILAYTWCAFHWIGDKNVFETMNGFPNAQCNLCKQSTGLLTIKLHNFLLSPTVRWRLRQGYATHCVLSFYDKIWMFFLCVCDFLFRNLFTLNWRIENKNGIIRHFMAENDAQNRRGDSPMNKFPIWNTWKIKPFNKFLFIWIA